MANKGENEEDSVPRLTSDEIRSAELEKVPDSCHVAIGNRVFLQSPARPNMRATVTVVQAGTKASQK